MLGLVKWILSRGKPPAIEVGDDVEMLGMSGKVVDMLDEEHVLVRTYDGAKIEMNKRWLSKRS